MNSTEKQLSLKNADRVKFMLSGKADIRVVSKRTGEEIIFRIIDPKENPGQVRWVLVKTNTPDLMGKDLTYIGFIILKPRHIGDDIKPFMWGERKAGLPKGDYRVRSFEWLWYKLVRDHADLNDLVEIHHVGRCGRCGRKLIDPESISRGLGPKCRHQVI